jgi:hypothetical protein
LTGQRSLLQPFAFKPIFGGIIMGPNSSNGNSSNTKPGMDNVTEKVKKASGKDDGHKIGVDGPFQNAPDEGREDVPKGDKIIKDHKTGEETYVENTGENY